MKHTTVCAKFSSTVFAFDALGRHFIHLDIFLLMTRGLMRYRSAVMESLAADFPYDREHH